MGFLVPTVTRGMPPVDKCPFLLEPEYGHTRGRQECRASSLPSTKQVCSQCEGHIFSEEESYH